MYTIFIVGAGFSKPAGLPLASDLFLEVVTLMQERDSELYENILQPDIERYALYEKRVNDIKVSVTSLDSEKFMSFLDTEHALGLAGSDTWNSEGNESQLALRNYIALVLQNSQREMSLSDEKLYDNFVDKLKYGDVILSLNYDTVLESALERQHKAYRLCPDRYKADGGHTDPKEIVLIKLHGSMDWFYIPAFETQEDIPDCRPHFLYTNRSQYRPECIVDCDSSPSDSKLLSIYKIRDLDAYFEQSEFLFQAPMIVAPSYVKEHYLAPLKEFFWGLNQTGAWSLGLSIIGFSLPKHDTYLLQAFYQLIRNFQEFDLGELATKRRLKMVDLRESVENQQELKDRYRFIDWSKTDVNWSGLDENAIDFLFS